VLLAKLITLSRSEGGKASRSSRPWRVLQACQSVQKVAIAPQRDRVAITVEFDSNLKIGRIVLVGGSENQPAAER
jgi:hypothetical protein